MVMFRSFWGLNQNIYHLRKTKSHQLQPDFWVCLKVFWICSSGFLLIFQKWIDFFESRRISGECFLIVFSDTCNFFSIHFIDWPQFSSIICLTLWINSSVLIEFVRVECFFTFWYVIIFFFLLFTYLVNKRSCNSEKTHNF